MKNIFIGGGRAEGRKGRGRGLAKNLFFNENFFFYNIKNK